MRYVDKNRINIETDNDIVGNCRFSVASEKFDNEVLIDFVAKVARNRAWKTRYKIQSRRCFASDFFCFADWIVFRIALVLYVQLDVSIVA